MRVKENEGQKEDCSVSELRNWMNNYAINWFGEEWRETGFGEDYHKWLDMQILNCAIFVRYLSIYLIYINLGLPERNFGIYVLLVCNWYL